MSVIAAGFVAVSGDQFRGRLVQSRCLSGYTIGFVGLAWLGSGGAGIGTNLATDVVYAVIDHRWPKEHMAFISFFERACSIADGTFGGTDFGVRLVERSVDDPEKLALLCTELAVAYRTGTAGEVAPRLASDVAAGLRLDYFDLDFVGYFAALAPAVYEQVRAGASRHGSVIYEWFSLLQADINFQLLRSLVGNHPARGTVLRRVFGPIELGRRDLIVGRDAMLRALHETDGATALTAVAGAGGVGKSTLARAFVADFGSEFDVVWWVRCGAPAGTPIRLTPTSVIDDLARLAVELNVATFDDLPEDRARRAVAALSTSEQRSLMVFDNAEHPDALRGWLPTSNCRVIITTRSTEFAAVAPLHHVTTLTPDLGAQVLLELVHDRRPNVVLDDQHDDARNLSRYLGGLPLALAQAGAFVAARPTETFLTFLNRVQADLPATLANAPRPDGYPEPAHRTYLVSIEAATNEHAATESLLLLLSFTDPDTDFPTELLLNAADAGRLNLDRAAVENTLAILTSFSLINETAGGIRVHRLVQAASRTRHPEPVQINARDALCDTIADVTSHSRDPETWTACAALVAHADAATTALPATRSAWNLHDDIATFIRSSGDHLGAVPRFCAERAPGFGRGDGEHIGPRARTERRPSDVPLDVPLIGHVPLDDFQRCAPDGRDEVAVRPQRGQATFEDRELLAQQARRSTFDQFDESMYPELRINTDEHMYVVRHRFDLDQVASSFLTDFGRDGFEPVAYVRCEDLASVLRAPHHVVGAGVDDVQIRFVLDHKQYVTVRYIL